MNKINTTTLEDYFCSIICSFYFLDVDVDDRVDLFDFITLPSFLVMKSVVVLVINVLYMKGQLNIFISQDALTIFVISNYVQQNRSVLRNILTYSEKNYI